MLYRKGHQKIAIVRIWEGLGNQLFQYSFARALQEKNNVRVYIDPYKSYEDLYHTGGAKITRQYSLNNFCITLPAKDITRVNSLYFLSQKNLLEKIKFCLAKKGIGKWTFYEQQEPYEYLHKLLHLNQNIYLKGWFQQELYFKDIRNILLDEIKPKKEVLINSSLKKVLAQQNVVSVHIRRGDFLKLGNVLPQAYYKKAVSIIKSKYSNPVFLVFSDEIQYAKRIFREETNVIFMSDEQSWQDYEELFIMSCCKHNIIANSTFSWWGAWLNQYEDKTVIAPRYWTSQKTKDTFCLPSEWVKL